MVGYRPGLDVRISRFHPVSEAGGTLSFIASFTAACTACTQVCNSMTLASRLIRRRSIHLIQHRHRVLQPIRRAITHHPTSVTRQLPAPGYRDSSQEEGCNSAMLHPASVMWCKMQGASADGSAGGAAAPAHPCRWRFRWCRPGTGLLLTTASMARHENIKPMQDARAAQAKDGGAAAICGGLLVSAGIGTVETTFGVMSTVSVGCCGGTGGAGGGLSPGYGRVTTGGGDLLAHCNKSLERPGLP